MRRIFLIKDRCLFQGEKYIARCKDYFEGWYFKNTTNKYGISFIPGISINKNGKKAFIQIIMNNSSYYIDYDFNDFTFSYDPFYIKIGNNYFSCDKIHIDIKDDIQNLVLYGEIKYSDSINIKTSLFSPNIMGPFSYLPFMECNHAVISMKNKANGLINFNNTEIIFKDDIGYIEKDWGCSFPKNYIWCQANNFNKTNASFMLSIADIPFWLFNFRGIICSLIINNHEYRFATYNGAKLVKYKINNNSFEIILKKKDYLLKVKSKSNTGLKLIAPVKGKMDKGILESISSYVEIKLKKKNKIIFSDTSNNCGLEIVNK